MRWVLMVAVWSGASGAACSRTPSEGASATQRAPASAEPVFGPVAESGGTGSVGPVAESNADNPPTEASAARASAGIETRSALPVVTGAELRVRIRQSGQKGVVVTAFASWCDPCREELPLLQAAAAKIAHRGVPIWLVSMDEPEAVADASALLASLHVSLPSFAAAPPLQAFKVALTPRWPGMIPASFLFDATGNLRYFWAGEVYEKELLPVVDGFLAGKHIDGTSDFSNSPGATQAGHE